jgi:hypothetical protein
MISRAIALAKIACGRDENKLEETGFTPEPMDTMTPGGAVNADFSTASLEPMMKIFDEMGLLMLISAARSLTE